jgi:hypothetical protein
MINTFPTGNPACFPPPEGKFFMSQPAECPEWTLAQWDGNKLLNRDADKPLWSNPTIDPPAVGAIVVCNDRKNTRVEVTGYEVDCGWLMVRGRRLSDGFTGGNLAGIEIKAVEPVEKEA